MDATPTLLSGTQIDARLAALGKADIAAVRNAAAANDGSPAAVIATSPTMAEAQAGLGLVPRPQSRLSVFYACH